MNTTHTPGPWDVDPCVAQIVDLNSGLPIAALQWPSTDRSKQETIANATLIAAAPDLLAACQHVVNTHKHHAQDCCKCEDCEYLRPITNAIRKALRQNA